MSDEKTETDELREDEIISDVYYSAEGFQSISHQLTVK